MTESLGNNKFYNTFTPFITPQTPSAEKTMKGRDFVVRKPPPDITREIRIFTATTSLLLIPMLAIGISRKSLKSAIKQAKLDYFRMANFEPDSWRKTLCLKLEQTRKLVCESLFVFVRKAARSKDKVTCVLEKETNNEFEAKIFRGVNELWREAKIHSAHKEYAKVNETFALMQELVAKQIDIIEKSANGQIKIAFDKKLLKNPQNQIPYAIDLTKTADGQNRIEQIKQSMDKIKAYLDSGSRYATIKHLISYNCDDIFFQAEDSLKNIFNVFQEMKNNSKPKKLIRKIYETLNKYRFAEITANEVGIPSKIIRQKHIENALKLIKELDTYKGVKIQTEISSLQHILINKTQKPVMGEVEKIRSLLKCDDIHPDILRDDVFPSVLKHYRTDDYIKTKQGISDFAEKLNFAMNTQSKYLDKRLNEISRGRVFPHMLSVIVPTWLLARKNEPKAKKREENKTVLFSFFLSSSAMIFTRYITMWKKTSSVCFGLFISLLAPHIYDKFFANNKKSS